MEHDNLFETSELNTIIAKFSPFVKEVRKRIVTTLIVFAIATIAGFIFYEQIIKFLINFLSLKGVNIVFTSPFQFINLAVSCGISTGLVVVFPVLIFHILHFLKPALKKTEYTILKKAIPFSMLLFLAGFSFGAIIMKWQIEIFLDKSVSLGIGNILDISGLLSVVFLTSALMGIGFQFPIILLVLLRISLINPDQLAKKRLWIYLASFIFALFLPPDSIFADILLSLPLIILFELTLIINYLLEKRNLRKLA